LKVVTRWIGPAGVEREGMEVESVWPMIISLVLNVFSCMSLCRYAAWLTPPLAPL